MRTRIYPRIEEAKEILEQALRNRHTVTMLCECAVKYSGNTITKMTKAERIIIIKSDRTVLIHDPVGDLPLSSMKSNSSIKFELGESRLILNFENVDPKEQLKVCTENINILSTSPIKHLDTIEVMASEADMARMIYEKPWLISKSFRPVGLEEQTKYGFVDVLGRDEETKSLVVVSCKRYKAGIGAIEELFENVKKIKGQSSEKNVQGVIAAPSIMDDAVKILNEYGFEFRAVEPPKQIVPDKSLQKKLV